MFFSGSAVWGHRGWASRFPDNVLAGIVAAAEVAAGVEVDIRRSADGHLVLSHDPAIAGHVCVEHPWATLAGIELGGGHRPTRLDELVDLAMPLDLEVKNSPHEPGFEGDHRIGHDVADMARPGDVVTSFWWPSIDAVRRTHPSVKTGLLFDSEVDWRHAISHAVDQGHRVIAPHHEIVDRELVDVAAREGLEVMVWTVNDRSDAVRLADLGVGAIITDRPGELIAESPTPGDSP